MCGQSIHFNHRTGTLWEGRYRAAPIDGEEYFFACSRYIELNPIWAGMVKHPRDYPWSSYRSNAMGEADSLVSAHPMAKRLGRSASERQKPYRNLFREKLAAEFLDDLRAAANGGWALGGSRFQEEIAEAAGRRAGPLPKGRPSAPHKDKRQLNLL